MIALFLAGVVVLTLVSVVLYGFLAIASGGFLRLVANSLITGMLLSLVLSTAGNAALVHLNSSSGAKSARAGQRQPEKSVLMLFTQCVCAALGQPSLTSMILLALLLLLCLSAAKVSALVEEMAILVDCHKAFLSRDETIAAGGMRAYALSPEAARLDENSARQVQAKKKQK